MKYFIPLFIFLSSFGNVELLAQKKKKQPTSIPSTNPATDVQNFSKIKDFRSLPRAPKSFLSSPLQEFKTNQKLYKQTVNQSFINIKRDQSSGLPIWISGTVQEAAAMRNANSETRCYHYLEAVKVPLQIEAPNDEFLIKNSSTDALGHTHIRMEQIYRGIPIYGSELILHEKNNEIYLLNGRHFRTPYLKKITPDISTVQAHHFAKNAIEKITDFKTISDDEKAFVAGEPFESKLVVFHNPENDSKPQLAYHVTVIPNLTERWEYFIDAHTGAVLHHHSSVCKFHAHRGEHFHKNESKNSTNFSENFSKKNNLLLGPATANAVDLLGITRTINTYEVGGIYYLYDGSRSMFNSNSQLPQDPQGMIVTIDGLNTSPATNAFDYTVITSPNNTWNNPSAVSGHYNGGEAYAYFKGTFNRESINGQGGNIISFINIADQNGGDMDNAFWNGAAMFYGNGDQAFTAPLAKALDVAGHEMAHGVIQSTANLEYLGQSGAMNESFADIFGAMIDRDDWQMGEDITNNGIFPTGALRDLSNPNNGGNSLNSPGWQPQTMSEYEDLPLTAQGDFGGVHINSGIVNYAYYLFATDIGKDKAEQIYYRALTEYLVKSSQFVDLRNAVVQAAGDLYGNAEINAANSAFDAVGIGAGAGGNYQNDVSVNDGSEFVLHSNANLDALYISDLSGNLVATPVLSNSNPVSKPSITDDGSIIVFVNDEQNLRFIEIDWANNTLQEGYIETNPDPVWSNVAISKDGRRIAANRNFVENVIYVYDFALGGNWQTFELYNPTTSDPNTGGSINTSDVQYADAMEFDFTGEFLMYDAFNKLESTFGDDIEYWDIGFLRVFDNNANTFGSGVVEKLFSGIPENVSIGNPTFSKNSPYIVAFDYFEEGFFSDTYQVWGVNIQTGDNQAIFENSTWSYPNYSVEDDQLIFDFPNSGTTILGKINLNSNKISAASTTVEALFPTGSIAEKWGVWFATGERDLVSTNEVEVANLKLKAFPNPFEDSFTLQLEAEKPETADIEIFDLLGKKVFQKNISLQVGQNAETLALQGFASGTYFVIIKMPHTTASLKLVKK